MSIDNSYCSGCGKELKNGAIFCSYCGAKQNIRENQLTSLNEPPKTEPLKQWWGGRKNFIIFVALVLFLMVTGFNVSAVSYEYLGNQEFLNKNSVSLAIEVASRLGITQTLSIASSASSFWQNERFLRELVNLLYDRYAPIKLPLILDFSKVVGWYYFKNSYQN